MIAYVLTIIEAAQLDETQAAEYRFTAKNGFPMPRCGARSNNEGYDKVAELNKKLNRGKRPREEDESEEEQEPAKAPQAATSKVKC